MGGPATWDLQLWGVIGTWVQAVGTVGAIGYALWEFARNRSDQLEQRRLETDRARRAHAECVSAWLVRHRDVALSNASDQLIYGVVVVPVMAFVNRKWSAEEMVDSRRDASSRSGEP